MFAKKNHTCHNITEVEPAPRRMKETLLTKHHLSKNKVLDDYPPPINDEETVLKISERTTLSQLRAVKWHTKIRYCHWLWASTNTDWMTR